LLDGSAGTRSSAIKLAPFVKVAGFAVAITPSSKSPLEVVVAFPLFGVALVPCADAETSDEFAVEDRKTQGGQD